MKTLICALAAVAALTLVAPANAAIFGRRQPQVVVNNFVNGNGNAQQIRRQPIRQQQVRHHSQAQVNNFVGGYSAQVVAVPVFAAPVIASPVYAAPVVQQVVTPGCSSFFVK